ncbi:DNA adenine methylase [Hydrogenophaga aquatica]
MRISPPFSPWLGGKSKLAARVVTHFPKHHTYVEPFGSSAAVLMAKQPSEVEVYNDMDLGLTNLFRVLRDTELFKRLEESCHNTAYSRAEFELALQPCEDPVEAARRFIVRQRQSHEGQGRRWSYSVDDAESGVSSAVSRWLTGLDRLPAIHHRMRRVQIESDDWRSVVKRYDTHRTLFYLDPAHMARLPAGDGRSAGFTEDDHHRLVDTVLGLQGMVVLSGHRCPAYERLEQAGWLRVDYALPGGYAMYRRERPQECLWLSPAARPQAEVSSIERMRQGAYITHRQRTLVTETQVIDSIYRLRAAGKRVTFTAVGKEIGMSREHLCRRYRHLFETA